MFKSLIIPKHPIIFEKLQQDAEVPISIVFRFEFDDPGSLNFCLELHLIVELIILVEVCLQVELEIGNDLLVVHALPIRHLIEIFIALHKEFWEIINCELLMQDISCAVRRDIGDLLLFDTSSLNGCLLLHHGIHLEHAQALLEELVVSLNLQRVAKTDLAQFSDDLCCPASPSVF